MLQMAPQVIFKHIFREHNLLADGLSKQALKLDMGHEISLKISMVWS